MSDPSVDLLDQVWSSIISLGRDLTEAEWKRPTDLPGWTVQDNLAHIIGTERMMAGEPAPEVTLGDTDHIRNPLGEANEVWIEARRSRTGADVLAEFTALVRAARTAPLPDRRSTRQARTHPGRHGSVPGVPRHQGHGQLGSRTGHAPRPRPPGRPRRSGCRPRAATGDQHHAADRGQAGPRARAPASSSCSPIQAVRR